MGNGLGFGGYWFRVRAFRGGTNASELQSHATMGDGRGMQEALLIAARMMGRAFTSRSTASVTVREQMGTGFELVTYEVLNILDFNSTRKRMSVICRTPQGKVLLFCKGADSVRKSRNPIGVGPAGELDETILMTIVCDAQTESPESPESTEATESSSFLDDLSGHLRAS